MDVVRPYLLPLTQSIPGPLKSAGESLIGKTCYRVLVEDLAPTSDCISLAFSKVLGIAIIAVASVVKVPQILSIVQKKSTEGLSLSSYLLETASFGISLAYNLRNGFPISTFGETALIVVQNIVISALILQYSGYPSSYVAGLVAAISVAAAALGSETIIKASILTYLQAGAGLLSIASKLPQIWTIYSSGSSGVLSLFTAINYTAGSASRIFTTLKEVDDPLILYGFIAGFILNAILAVQIYYYRPAVGAGKKPTKKAIKSSSAKPKAKTPRAPRTREVDSLASSFTDSGSETPGGTRRSTRRRA